ncbi:SDR family NAD(P)-dependent oxidoreductase [Devosia sp. 2618]|uniref:SDR family NAD(P)-dependent oxidoreductase n=1 Tax=Devosia sp. 2618 TaxID=3156454 RepID=UPI003391D110
MAQQVWFITGSSRGFGRELVRSALAAGDFVVATARRPEQLADLVEQYGDRILPVALDVTDAAAAQHAIEAAVTRFGRVDVVVNNAGYANVFPIETGPEADFRAQFETNFWGVYNVSRAAVTAMRKQGHGTIVQFSSVGGRVGGNPGIGAYQAAKFAVDGFSRVLAVETAPFGIKVLVIEPSGFATDWAGSSMKIEPVTPGYEDTVGALVKLFSSSNVVAAGDPARGAEIIVNVVKRDTLPSHLLLGVNAVDMSRAYSNGQLAELETWAGVSKSADTNQPFPQPFPADAAAK